MSYAFKYRKVTGFPQLELWHDLQTSEDQKYFEDMATVPITILKRTGASGPLAFERYEVTHENWWSRMVRFEGELRNRVVVRHSFMVYVHRSSGFILANCNDKLCDGFLRRLQGHVNGLRYASRTTDLKLIHSKLESQVRGVWWGDLQIPGVRSAALYGPAVDGSSEWQHYQTHGVLSALSVEYGIDNLYHKLQFSRKGSYVIYGDLQEELALALALRIEDFIRDAVTLSEER